MAAGPELIGAVATLLGSTASVLTSFLTTSSILMGGFMSTENHKYI